MRRVILGTALPLLVSCGLFGQPAETPPAFEVASVKPAPPREGNAPFRVGCSGGPGSRDPGLYTCSNSNIANLVMQAYGLKRYQLPASAFGDTALYNITAKVPPEASREQVKLMLQNLLAERFKLTFHYEKKETPAYELVVAKGGPKLTESPPEPPPAADGAVPPPPSAPAAGPLSRDAYGIPIIPMRRGVSTMMSGMNGVVRLMSSDTSMDQLATTLSAQLSRPVTDSTGLKGKYDITLTYVSPNVAAGPSALPAASAPGAVPAMPESEAGPTIFAAVEKELGLKLEQKKAIIDIFVIDHAEKAPVEN